MSLPPQLEALSLMMNEPHYKAIGKVVANWAALEAIISSALWRLARVDDTAGVCLTSQIPNMPGRMNALISLAKLRNASDGIIRKLHKFADDTPGLQEQRNRVAHDPWRIDLSTGQLQRLEVSARKTAKLQYVPVSVEEIESVVDRILAHVNRCCDLMDEMFRHVDREAANT
jgi:hypothetical protein